MANRKSTRNHEMISDDRLIRILRAGPIDTNKLAARLDMTTGRILQRMKVLPGVIPDRTETKVTVWRLI